MSNFLTSAFRVSYSGVNHVIPLTDILFNNDTGTDMSFCLEDGSRSDSVRRRLERAAQREDSNAVRKFEISAATCWGRVVVRCLTFLPTHLEPVIQGLIMWIHGKDW